MPQTGALKHETIAFEKLMKTVRRTEHGGVKWQWFLFFGVYDFQICTTESDGIRRSKF